MNVIGTFIDWYKEVSTKIYALLVNNIFSKRKNQVLINSSGRKQVQEFSMRWLIVRWKW